MSVGVDISITYDAPGEPAEVTVPQNLDEYAESGSSWLF